MSQLIIRIHTKQTLKLLLHSVPDSIKSHVIVSVGGISCIAPAAITLFTEKVIIINGYNKV